MSVPDGAGFLLALDAVWLALLALGAVALRREIVIVQRRVMLAGEAVPDGLEVGSPVPREADPDVDRVLLFLYPHCEPCAELAPRLRSLSRPELLEVVISGPAADGGQETMLGRLPDSLVAVAGADGERLGRSFDVRSGPLALAVRDGLVVAKGYVNNVSEIEFLVSEAARSGRP